jgi:hypothetical protein
MLVEEGVKEFALGGGTRNSFHGWFESTPCRRTDLETIRMCSQGQEQTQGMDLV